MKHRVTLARSESPSVGDIVDDMYRRGLRFPTGKLHGVMMRFFDKADLPTAIFVLKQHGLQEVRSGEANVRTFHNGEREAYLYTNVPDYYLDKIGIMLV